MLSRGSCKTAKGNVALRMLLDMMSPYIAVRAETLLGIDPEMLRFGARRVEALENARK